MCQGVGITSSATFSAHHSALRPQIGHDSLLPVIEYRMDLLLHDPQYLRTPKLEGQATDDTAFTAMVWPALLVDGDVQLDPYGPTAFGL